MILDRNEAITARQDPFGHVWGVRAQNKELSFWIVGKLVDTEVRIPSTYPNASLEGKWTRMKDALAAIVAYLEQAWDMADEAKEKTARKDYNAKIETKREKLEAKAEAA